MPFPGLGGGWRRLRRSRGGKGTGAAAAAREAGGNANAARTGAPQDGAWARGRRRRRLCRGPGTDRDGPGWDGDGTGWARMGRGWARDGLGREAAPPSPIPGDSRCEHALGCQHGPG